MNWAGGKNEITVVEFEAEKNGNKVNGYVCTHFFNQLVKIYRDDELN